MIKKFAIVFLISNLIIFLVVDSANAGLFKKKTARFEKKASQEKVKKEEEKKVLVAEIFASWCPGCKNIQPTLDQLIKETSGIEFIQLDVSTPSKAKTSAKLAKDLNILEFYKANKSKTATVGVIVSSTSEVINVFQNNNDIEEYKSAIEEAKTKEKSLYVAPE